jgi:adenylosuccinate synthase
MEKAKIIVGLLFEDEGKGSITAALTHKYKSELVVKISGAAQAGHNVITSDNLWHEFCQIGSGMFEGAQTLLSKYVLVNPIILMEEVLTLHNKKFTALSKLFSSIFVDERALVVTPYHVAVNRLRELYRQQQSSQRHGSCGKGGWEAVMYKNNFPGDEIYIKDIFNNILFTDKLLLMRDRLLDIARSFNLEKSELVENEINVFENSWVIISDIYDAFIKNVKIFNESQTNELITKQKNPVIFETTQGILLDQNYGFFPYVTNTTVTSENANKVLDEAGFTGERETIGIIRTFMTRHGAGPFPTEAPLLKPFLNDPHNHTNLWQQSFRIGWLDLSLIKYAIDVNGGIDSLAITHVDSLTKIPEWKVCTEYENLILEKQPTVELVEQNITNKLFDVKCEYEVVKNFKVCKKIREELNLPIRIASYGPKSDDKLFYENGELIES